MSAVPVGAMVDENRRTLDALIQRIEVCAYDDVGSSVSAHEWES